MGIFMLEVRVMKSDTQKQLENNGCRFNGQELMSNHQVDITKPCYCGRPNYKGDNHA